MWKINTKAIRGKIDMAQDTVNRLQEATCPWNGIGIEGDLYNIIYRYDTM